MSDLTKAFLKANNVAFFPASQGESRHIQRRLFALGCKWVNSGAQIASVEGSVEQGIAVIGGTMYTISDEDQRDYIVASLADLCPTTSSRERRELQQIKARLSDLEGLVANRLPESAGLRLKKAERKP